MKQGQQQEQSGVLMREALERLTNVTVEIVFPGGEDVDDGRDGLYHELVGSEGEIGKLMESVGDNVVTYERQYFERTVITDAIEMIRRAFASRGEQILIENRQRFIEGHYEELMRPYIVHAVRTASRVVMSHSHVQVLLLGSNAQTA